jgi:hypothetical protein
MSAVILLQEECLTKTLSGIEDDGEEEEGLKDRTAVLAIAYHNMGVEQEFLQSVRVI